MIVRIATEAQYLLPDEDADRLRELDDELVVAIENDEEERFHKIFEQMLLLVRTDGHPVDDDSELSESDVIMPPPDLSFAEAKEEFGADGLIPD